MTWRGLQLQEWSNKCNQRVSIWSYPVWPNAGQTPWQRMRLGLSRSPGRCWLLLREAQTFDRHALCSESGHGNNDSIQLYMWSGRSRYENFLKTALCRTLSKALEKSMAKTTTNGLFSIMVVTVWRRWTNAAVVEPVDDIDQISYYCIFKCERLKVEWCWKRRQILHFLNPCEN